MRVEPIPKHLLIHSVSYQEFTGIATWGETYAAAVTLSNVLVQPSTELVKDTIRETINGRALLFYDAVNSAPFMDNFVEKSLVSFEGHDYTVDNVKIFYAFDNTPHHYEIVLV